MACSAGKIFLYARSPVAPKNTKASEWLVLIPTLPLLRRLFDVAAELVAHGREQLVAEVRLAARAEALVEGRGEDGHRHGLVDGRPDRPPALAGIRHAPLEALERRVLDEGRGRQVEEPGGHDA